MNIIETLTGTSIKVSIQKLQKDDFKKLDKKRYFFNWNKFKNGYQVYKLTKNNSDDILGVMAFFDVPSELRIEIPLICCSRENYSSNKQFDRIAGTLIAFACMEAIIKYGENAAVSLIPKTRLRLHYIKKYNMEEAGLQVFLFGENLKNMVKEYL